jgi:hypothetical protein
MDPHRLAEERSIAYHALVAERLRVDAAILTGARERVEGWAQDGSVHPRWVDDWRKTLELSLDDLTRVLVERSERANALRQVTPFAGVIDARTRWRLWREVRERSSAA